MSHVRLALIAGLVLVLALGGLTGWLGFRAYQSHKADELRKLYLQVGRQGALNLTTIDFERADADVQRILDSATGTFYDDFQERAQPFVEVVKQAQSKSVGTVAEAGLVSESENQAAGAGGGDRRDVECRCARTGATRVANADHGRESRGRGQGGQGGFRGMSKHGNDSSVERRHDRTCRHRNRGCRAGRRADGNRRRAGAGGRAGEASDCESSGRGWSPMACLPALALILAMAAGFLKWQDNSVRSSQIARIESVQAAKDTTVKMLSYKPDSVDTATQRRPRSADGRIP